MNWKATAYIAIFVLIFLDFLFFNIPVGPLRMTLLRVLILIIFEVMLLRFLIKKDLNISNIKFPLVFLGVWFFYGVLSILWAANKTAVIKELYYFALFILLIIVLIYLLQKVSHRIIHDSFWIGGLIIVYICFVEFALDLHLPTSRYLIEAERFSDLSLKRATAFFYNENDLGLFLVMIVPFYLTGILNKSLFLKTVNFLVIASILVINYINDSRLSIIAILIQLLFFGWFAYKPIFLKVLRFMLLVSPLILAGIVLVLLPIIQTGGLFEGIQQGRGSGFIRMNLYFNSLYATFQSFMLGVGPGNFQYNMYPMFDTLGIVNPHNWWLEVLTTYGFLIFIGYCVFFLFLTSKLYLIYHSGRKNRSFALTLLLSYLGFIVASLGPSSIFYFWPMWLLYGVSLAFISKSEGS